MKQINELIDDCLRLIFQQFPLVEAVSLRHVCHRWKDIIEQMCFEKNSLKVFYKFDHLGWYCEKIDRAAFRIEPDFALDQFNEHGGSFGDDFVCIPHVWSSHNFVPFKCDLLPDIFPNVTKLIVCCGGEYSDVNVIHLLQRWQDLQFLALFDLSAKRVGKSKSPPHQLWQVINTMKSLKYLTLFYGSDMFGFDERRPNRCPYVNLSQIMPQLKHFSVSQFSLDLLLFMKPLNICQNLKSLSFIDYHSPDVHLKFEKAFILNSRLKQSITRFKISPVYFKLLNVIVHNLKAVTHLTIATTAGVKFTDFIKAISKMKDLVELRFSLGRNKLIESGDTVHSTLHTLPVPLKSIKTLHSNIQFTLYEFRSIFPVVFPSVEQLSLHLRIYLPEVRAEPSVQAYFDKFERLIKDSSPPLFVHLKTFICFPPLDNTKNIGLHLKEYEVWQDFWDEKLGCGKYAISEE